MLSNVDCKINGKTPADKTPLGVFLITRVIKPPVPTRWKFFRRTKHEKRRTTSKQTKHPPEMKILTPKSSISHPFQESEYGRWTNFCLVLNVLTIKWLILSHVISFVLLEIRRTGGTNAEAAQTRARPRADFNVCPASSWTSHTRYARRRYANIYQSMNKTRIVLCRPSFQTEGEIFM